MEFSKRSADMFLAQSKQLKQSQSLSQLRDTLLAKLLSGELTIPVAEAQLTEVAHV